MPYVDEDGVLVYHSPKNWDEISSDYDGNGDCADWIYAIRDAMLERYNVIYGGNRIGSHPEYLVQPLGNMRVRNSCELYDFAIQIEKCLDRLLTTTYEFGTVNNTTNPDHEWGYFVNPEPSQFMKRVDYKDDYDGSDKSTVVFNYLKIADVIQRNGMNYKAALADVRRGDPIAKFVPWFSTVKNVINYLTCVPCSVWYYQAGSALVAARESSVSDLITDFEEEYDEEMADEPELDYVRSTSEVWLNNYCFIENLSTTNYPSFYGGYRWNHAWFYGISNKFPMDYEAELYRTSWGEKSLTHASDNNEYSWDNGEYSFDYMSLGTCTGPEHKLDNWTNKFPASTMTYPSTPSQDETNLAGYYLNINFVADFGIDNGFRFRNAD